MTDISRGEFDMLRSTVKDSLRRIETRLDRHLQDHEQEEQARTSGRRWLIGTIVAILAVVEPQLIWLIGHLH